MFFVPMDKIKALLEKIEYALKFEYATPRFIVRIAGQIASMSPAIGPLTRLFTKQMHIFIESRFSWDAPKLIPFEVNTELLFWKTNLEKSNGL